MAFIQLAVHSHQLQVGVNVNVIMPEGRKNPPKVLYLLHGLSDDHTIWMRRSGIDRYAPGYNVAVVMPAVGRSFYTDQKNGYKYYSYVAEELPSIIEKMFNVSTKREDTFVAGLSMGGYGAMKLALANPDKFSKAASFSGCLNVKAMFEKGDPGQEMRNCFGDNGPEDIDDVMHLLEKNASNPNKPQLYQACGTKDFLYQQNLDFKAKAIELGYDLTYTEEPETHNWGYWDKQIDLALMWMFNKKWDK